MPEITQKLNFDASSAISNLSALTGQLTQANKALAGLQGTATGSKALTGTTKQLKTAKTATNEMTVSWKTMARVLQTQILVRSLNALIQGLKQAIIDARDLGIAIEEIRTIDSEGRGAGGLTADILDLSDAIGKAPIDLAEGLYQTLSNQVVEAGEALQFTSEAAKLATITASDTGDAVNALSSVMNSYQLSASDAARVSDTLFKTVEQGRLRLGEIANVIGRVTPLTAALGVSWEEAAAALATMTRQGVRADTAITQLRAVVTRLIKPSDEMRQIFRQWGVVDAKQAIATFGGLTGVLRKLEEETGGTSEGMADLLRNVRAITGQLGIMVNEGELVAEVMGEIDGNSGAAAEAWDEFAKSDAQQFTIQMQQLSNQFVRFGGELLPGIVTQMKFLNEFIAVMIKDLKIVTGTWNEAEEIAEDYADAVREGVEEANSLRTALADAGADAYTDLQNASNLYYAEANKKEFALADIRDAGIKGALVAFESAGKNLTDFYSKSISDLESFAKSAESTIAGIARRNAATREKIEDRILDNKLRKATSEAEKELILQGELDKARTKSFEAFDDLSAGDPESLKAFEKAQERVIELTERRAALVREGREDSFDDLAAQKDIIAAERSLIAVREQFADQTERAATASQDHITGLAEGRARLLELAKQEKKLLEDDRGGQAQLDQLEAIKTERKKINDDLAKSATKLKDFGLDTDFGNIVTGLEEALNTARKDWAIEVRAARAAFKDALIPIKFALDPTGLKRQVNEALGLVQTDQETTAQFLDRGAEQIANIKTAELKTQSEINSLIQEGAKARIESTKLVGKLEESVAAGINKDYRERIAVIDQFGEVTAEQATKQAEIAQQAGTIGNNLVRAYRNAFTELSAGTALQEGHITGLSKLAETAGEKGQITEQELLWTQSMTEQLLSQQKLAKQITQERQQLPDQDVSDLGSLLSADQKAVEAAARTELEVRQDIDRAQAEHNITVDELLRRQQAVTESANQSAEANKGAAGAAAAVGTNTQNSTGALTAATTQANLYADALERAALASASISAPSGGVAAANGGRFFADGGMARGQDRIPASLASGEMVVNSKSSRRFFSELNAMNQGSQPVFREQGGPVTNVGDVNVTVNGGDSSQQTVREIGHALRREIQRGNLKLR